MIIDESKNLNTVLTVPSSFSCIIEVGMYDNNENKSCNNYACTNVPVNILQTKPDYMIIGCITLEWIDNFCWQVNEIGSNHTCNKCWQIECNGDNTDAPMQNKRHWWIFTCWRLELRPSMSLFALSNQVIGLGSSLLDL